MAIIKIQPGQRRPTQRPAQKNTPAQRGTPANPSTPMNMGNVQKFTSFQPFVIGQDFAQPVGLGPKNKLDLSGQTGMLVGINLYTTATGETKFTLNINQEDVISTANLRFYNPDFNKTQNGNEYFSVNRPLSGSDVVNLQTQGTVAGQVYIVMYIQPMH